ncbi:MAG: acetyl-CoA C-acyltransferase [Cellvibrionales bacterium]|nr:acetyl-CoA C-acyltransferase [Cellvibrionales bacterium]
MIDDPVVIVAAARTPMGAFQGAFSTVSAVELGAVATRLALKQSGLVSADVDELLFGCVLPASLLQAPARQVALAADLPLTTQCTTVNKVCGSGMKTTMLAHDQILAGSCDTAITGGMENMTQSPYFIAKARGGLRLGHGEIKDHMFCDGLEDAYSGRLMGSFAQQTADQFSISREQMDNYAIESLTRAQTAIAQGFFDAEIAPVIVKTRKGEITVSVDEQPGNANIEKIPKLKPAFAKEGTVTAANSSSISDGAAALVLMKQSRANTLGLKPLARIVAHASHAQHPSEFTMAPVGAMNKVLNAANWTVDTVDLFEINEAFAMVTLLAMQELNLDPKKVNVNGGACALGHPLGASGARIIVTLIYALQRLKKQRGVASLCIGGGEATAIAIEMI